MGQQGILEAAWTDLEAMNLDLGLRRLKSRQRLRHRARLLSLGMDIAVLTGAFCIANVVRFSAALHAQGLQMLAVLLPIYLLVAFSQRAFSIETVVNPRVGASRSLTSFIIALSAVGFVVFFLKVSSDFSRAVFGLGAVLSLISLPLARSLLSRATKKGLGASAYSEVILEDAPLTVAPNDAVIFNARRHNLLPQLDDPSMLDRLGRYLQHADRVIVSCPPERREVWAMALKGANVNAEVLLPDLDTLGAIGLSEFKGHRTLLVAAGPLGISDQLLKRAFDLTVLLVSMPVTLPIMVAVGLAVKLDSPGPIFFAQERFGLGNRIFKMYKFRSMFSDRTDHLGNRSASRSDDRITRVGRFIRATSLDELPQLLNVLLGDMSIVGPRPHPLLCKAEDKLLWEIDLRYWHRHAVKPGLTGLAQVRGHRGATERESQFVDRLQADLEYVAGWSIWRDIRIVAATFRVLVHRNAF